MFPSQPHLPSKRRVSLQTTCFSLTHSSPNNTLFPFHDLGLNMFTKCNISKNSINMQNSLYQRPSDYPKLCSLPNWCTPQPYLMCRCLIHHGAVVALTLTLASLTP